MSRTSIGCESSVYNDRASYNIIKLVNYMIWKDFIVFKMYY